MKWMRDDQATADLLDLATDRLAPLTTIAAWSDDQCRQAEAYAAARHFQASDNDVKVPPMPAHVAALPSRATSLDDADLSGV